jgi:hypothetical protein
MDGVRRYMGMRLLRCNCVVFALCFGSSSAFCETPTLSAASENPDGISRHALTIKDVKPYHFTRPRAEARGLRVVVGTIDAPNGPQIKSLTEGYFSAVLSPTLRRDWDIVAFNAYEIAEGKGESRRPDPSIIVPSRCNDFPNYEIRYRLADMRTDRRYRVEYLLWPRTSTANPAATIASLRSTTEDALTVKVWYEFAIPYEEYASGISGRDRVRGALSDRRSSIHN